MNELAEWLRRALKERGLTQNQVAVYAGVGQATLSDMLNKGHVPKVETLFRLADFFGSSRLQVLRLAGHLPPAGGSEAGSTGLAAGGGDEALVRDLLEEFRRVPDEWKAVAVEQVAQFRRLAELRPMHLIGDDEEETKDAGETAGEVAAQAA